MRFDLARLALANGHPTDAILLARQTLGAYEQAFGPEDLQTAAVNCFMGESLRSMRNFPDAEELLQRCADIRESAGGIDSTELADALHSLAMVEIAQHKYQQAEPRLKLAEKIRENKLGLMNPLVAQTMEDRANLLRTIGRDQEAAKLTALVSAIRRQENRKQ